jgi:ankyrin repeat protein
MKNKLFLASVAFLFIALFAKPAFSKSMACDNDADFFAPYVNESDESSVVRTFDAALHCKCEVIDKIIYRRGAVYGGSNLYEIFSTTYSTYTPLMAASAVCCDYVVTRLLEPSRRVSVNAKNSKGQTALDLAKANDCDGVADLLIAAGAKESVVKVEEPKKEEPKKDVPKKEIPKKETPKKDGSAVNSNIE